MGLVDLRGREGHDDVRALVGEVAPETVTIGWEEDGSLVACASVARDGADLRMLSLVGDAAGRLVDALAEMVNARRLLAADGSVLRELDATPAAPEAVRATTLAEVERAIRASWSADTSASPERWSEENPALGQCDVTALTVRDLFGGDTVIANVVRDGERLERHVWNRLPGGVDVDLTREQYRDGEQLTEPRVEEPLGLADGRERYERFSARVRALLAS